MSALEAFLLDIDGRWRADSTARVALHLIGSTALMLQAQYERGTKDSDILETAHLTLEARQQLQRLAGQGSRMHQRHRLYIDIVASGLPFLPQVPVWHAMAELSSSLKHFDVAVLDVVDVVVTKLKRMSPSDAADVEAMIEGGHVQHDLLVARFLAAVDWYLMDARAHDLPRYIANLHRVERDFLGVEPTKVELPGWV